MAGVVSAGDVNRAAAAGQKQLHVPAGAVIPQVALERAKELGVEIVNGRSAGNGAAAPTVPTSATAGAGPSFREAPGGRPTSVLDQPVPIRQAPNAPTSKFVTPPNAPIARPVSAPPPGPTVQPAPVSPPSVAPAPAPSASPAPTAQAAPVSPPSVAPAPAPPAPPTRTAQPASVAPPSVAPAPAPTAPPAPQARPQDPDPQDPAARYGPPTPPGEYDIDIKPRYFETDGMDNIYHIAMELGAALWVVKDRQRVQEELLEKAGVLNRDLIESYVNDPAQFEDLSARRQAFIEKIYGILAEGTTA